MSQHFCHSPKMINNRWLQHFTIAFNPFKGLIQIDSVVFQQKSGMTPNNCHVGLYFNFTIPFPAFVSPICIKDKWKSDRETLRPDWWYCCSETLPLFSEPNLEAKNRADEMSSMRLNFRHGSCFPFLLSNFRLKGKDILVMILST